MQIFSAYQRATNGRPYGGIDRAFVGTGLPDGPMQTTDVRCGIDSAYRRDVEDAVPAGVPSSYIHAL